MKTSMQNKSLPIDVVIAWVDGSDSELSKKRQLYLSSPAGKVNSSALPTRFASVNEIKYCVLSILKFATFVRNIYIVTDNQDPKIFDEVKKRYPERLSSIKIVDHTEIFEGFETFLPTFNSISIGNMIWRIKGIANNFVYFNDDTFLIRSINPSDWFIDDKPVIRGKWVVAPFHRILWKKLQMFVNKKLLRKKDYQPRASFHMGQWNSAALTGHKWRYFTNSHTPHTVGKELVANYFAKNKTILEKNIAHRFRNPSQFTFIALSNHLQLLNGNKHATHPSLAYMQPFNRSENYTNKKIKFCEQNKNIKYLCVQSLDMCSVDEQNKILGWMETILE